MIGHWTGKCFSKFEGKIDNKTNFQIPRFYKKFILTTDASNQGLGAELSQGEIGADLPVLILVCWDYIIFGFLWCGRVFVLLSQYIIAIGLGDADLDHIV
jgi:hypothetical protein